MAATQRTFIDRDQVVWFLREAFAVNGLLAQEACLFILGRAQGSHAGALEALLGVVHKRLGRFRRIHVEYRPENPYGYVARLSCRCTDPERQICPHACQSEGDRPRLALVLREVGGREVVLGSAWTVPARTREPLLPPDPPAAPAGDGAPGVRPLSHGA